MEEQSAALQSAQGQPSDRLWAVALRLVDEAFVTARWLMATLVTINSGAVFGLASAKDVPLAAKLTGGCWFCAGIVGAIFLGVFQMNGARVAVTALLKTPATAYRKVKPWLVFAWISGLASLGCFVTEAIQTGVNLK